MTKISNFNEPSGTSSSDIDAFWRSSPLEHGKPVVDLTVPDGLFSHNVFDVGDCNGSRRVNAGFLQVTEAARGNGIGEKLVRGLGAVTQLYDFPEIYVCIASQYSLDIFERVFGRDRITFHGLSFWGVDLRHVVACPPSGKLDISLGQARGVLSALEPVEKDIEMRQLGFPVTINLDGLDMSTWGLPEECYHDQVDIESIRPKVVPNP